MTIYTDCYYCKMPLKIRIDTIKNESNVVIKTREFLEDDEAGAVHHCTERNKAIYAD